jgi:integrase/transcription elongation factor Elf1
MTKFIVHMRPSGGEDDQVVIAQAEEAMADLYLKVFGMCPLCDSPKVLRDGNRKLKTGVSVQRYVCKECGHRFTIKDNNYIFAMNISQIGADKVKNLVDSVNAMENQLAIADESRQPQLPILMPQFADEIDQYDAWMKKNGMAESTRERRVRLLNTMAKRGIDILDSEDVKVGIANQDKWSVKTKALAVECYQSFLEMTGQEWAAPIYKPTHKIPRVPSEEEVDALISGCNIKTSAFLQILKETGARFGEAWALKWTDFNIQDKTVDINDPEKHSNPRKLPISDTCNDMLGMLPRDAEKVFKGSDRHFARGFRRQRKKLAAKLGDNLLKVGFHSFRHFKGTQEYRKTKDIVHVQYVLGHKSITNTMLYIQLCTSGKTEYYTAVARTVEEAENLGKNGFELYCEFQGDIKLFRKPK